MNTATQPLQGLGEAEARQLQATHGPNEWTDREHHGLARTLAGVLAEPMFLMLLVAGGGLFARSLYNLQHLDRGFDSSGVVSFSIDPSLSGYDQGRIRQLADRLVAW